MSGANKGYRLYSSWDAIKDNINRVVEACDAAQNVLVSARRRYDPDKKATRHALLEALAFMATTLEAVHVVTFAAMQRKGGSFGTAAKELEDMLDNDKATAADLDAAWKRYRKQMFNAGLLDPGKSDRSTGAKAKD